MPQKKQPIKSIPLFIHNVYNTYYYHIGGIFGFFKLNAINNFLILFQKLKKRDLVFIHSKIKRPSFQPPLNYRYFHGKIKQYLLVFLTCNEGRL